MRNVNVEFVKNQARHPDNHDSDFAKAVALSIEVGVVVPSILRANLKSAGFKLVDDEAKMSEYGFKSTNVLKRVLVVDNKGDIVAMGAAGDEGEALVHAALGWFRENKVGEEEAPEGLTVLGE